MATNNDSLCVLTHFQIGNIHKLSFAVTFDSGDGSFHATDAGALEAVVSGVEGRLLKLVTNPGSTAPTTLYDITLVDQNGADVLQGVGADRSATLTETAAILISGTSCAPAVDECDTLTLTIINNSVHSATTVIEVTYALGG